MNLGHCALYSISGNYKQSKRIERKNKVPNGRILWRFEKAESSSIQNGQSNIVILMWDYNDLLILQKFYIIFRNIVQLTTIVKFLK